ncbi:MAG: Mpo1-like protein [Acidobacteriota bacterium]
MRQIHVKSKQTEQATHWTPPGHKLCGTIPFVLTIGQQFEDYGAHHRTPGNKLFHRIGIPMIMFSLIGLLARLVLLHGRGWQLDAAMLLIAAAELFYLALNWRLAVAMLLVSVAFYFGAQHVPIWLLVTLFILGWIAQFVGHGVYEKRRPAFMRNLVHLLIGPLWILNDVVPVVPAKLPEVSSSPNVQPL